MISSLSSFVITYVLTIIYMFAFSLNLLIRLIMTGILSMEGLLNFYKVRVESAPTPITLRALFITLPIIKPEAEPTVTLQTLIDVTALLSITVTYCMVIFCILKNCSSSSIIQKKPSITGYCS